MFYKDKIRFRAYDFHVREISGEGTVVSLKDYKSQLQELEDGILEQQEAEGLFLAQCSRFARLCLF